MRRCLIKQPAGLGDIIFCQKIADTFINNGYIVHWPVIDEYYKAISEHMKKEGIVYCKQADDYPLKKHYETTATKPIMFSNGDAFLPLVRADLHYPNQSVLHSKYKILNLEHHGWQDHFKFVRNKEREAALFYDVLGIRDGDRYSLVNLRYGSPPCVTKKKITFDLDCDKIEMSMENGYTIFDWCKVIENASQIYCVDTSLFYIIDMLDLAATRLEAYSKFDPANYIHIEGLFNKPWNYN